MEIYNELVQATKEFTGLQILQENESFYLEGILEISQAKNGPILGSFLVEIRFPQKFPYCFPRVIETSKKIERIADRHVYRDNSLCFAVDVEEYLLCINSISVSWFINHILIPRLCEEINVIEGGSYHHEWPHNTPGKIKYFQHFFNVGSTDQIIDLLYCIKDIDTNLKSELCICGSGEKFKRCHFNAVIKLSVLDKKIISDQIELIKTEIWKERIQSSLMPFSHINKIKYFYN